MSRTTDHIAPNRQRISLSRWRHAIAGYPLLAAAWGVILLVVICAVLGPWICPHDPIRTDLSLRLASPSWQYPLGNDSLGRCLLSRILYGTRASIGLGGVVVIFSCLAGVGVGLVAGYIGGWIDECLMRVTDVFFSFPEIVAAMAVSGLLGPGTFNLLLALSVTSWMRYARVIRSITLSARERDWVKAAKLAGVSTPVIIGTHILPASLPTIAVMATVGIGKAVLAVSALGFLGFGVQPPQAEWGMLLMEGKDYILSAPHLSVFPGLAIVTTVLAFNIIGDNLFGGKGLSCFSVNGERV